uniref:Concanavalin A-like lectin/glucanase, subgroup n=1 Tax=Cynara cardunculus var. scolymus TaxID=59895 RepID=A0A103XV45_CYNCS
MLRITEKIMLFFIVIVINLFPLFVSQDIIYPTCDESANFTINGTYQRNLDNALLSLISDTSITYGFYNRSVGETPDRVHVIALCRGDVDQDDCRRCINGSITRLREICPNQKGAIGWYDTCMLRYSNLPIWGNPGSMDTRFQANPQNTSNVDQFNQGLYPLLDQLIVEASSGGSLRKYASNYTRGRGGSRIFGIMQCTPDLSEFQCYNCLDRTIQLIPVCCDGRRGLRVLYPSCNLRYEDYSFFDEMVVLPPPPWPQSPPRPSPQLLPPPPSPLGKTNNTSITVIAIVATLSLVILVVLFVFVFIRRKRKLEGRPANNFVYEDVDINEISTTESLQYSFGIIREATNDFSESNKLGQGGFGSVYKGKLQNGKEIAVKRLSKDSRQGEQEFKNEVLLLARLQHRNLVRLLGFSTEESERILIYEFVQNGSLDQFIFSKLNIIQKFSLLMVNLCSILTFSDPMKRAALDWERRYKVIQGVARGLLYLHEDSRLKIIHRDLKASNVLLDAQMNPKIADFGMARLFTCEESQGNTSQIAGTYGYMAPEYLTHGQFSVKSDVFSFGVLVLEIVMGQKNSSFQDEMVTEDLLSHAWKSWKAETTSSLIDPTLIMKDGPISLRDMIRCIHIGLLGVQEDAIERPTMASVVLMLSSLSITLTFPSEPAFFLHTGMNPENPLFEEYASSTSNSSYSKNKSKSSRGSIARDISLNLDNALSTLTSNTTITYGFYNRSVGENPDKANVMALCRGDVERDDCRRCINDSRRRLRESCPNQKGAMNLWSDGNCMVRYSNEPILGNPDINSPVIYMNPNNASGVDRFNQALNQLLNQLRNNASSGGSSRKYASGTSTNGPWLTTIYGAMQCTPDLSEGQCENCLNSAMQQIPNCCDGKLGVRVIYPSCDLRYENYSFFKATLALAPPPPPTELSPPSPPPSDKSSNTSIIIIIVVVATISLVILVATFVCIFKRRKKNIEGRLSQNLVYEDVDVDKITTAESLQYSFAVIRAATDDFSENNKLGQGGFGSVYKGKLPNGQEIAVKRLSNNSGQGEQEFKNEVLLLARLRHRNLVRLLGFSLEGSERLLMYEFLQNASLDQFIFDPVKRASLDWELRYKIIHGVAKGLLYLHEDSRLKIIHRDMKASNVLLDVNMIAKIADFGMARLVTLEETQVNTSRIVGTYGYMAPEYALHGQFSVKSDVFSFGVLVLEIVTGCKNHSFQNGTMVEDLLSHAWKSWRDGTISSLIDPTLKDGSNSLRDMIRCIHIGLLCVQEDVTDRPTMASVVLMLGSLSLTLAVPSEPAFFIHTSKPELPLFEEYTSSTGSKVA